MQRRFNLQDSEIVPNDDDISILIVTEIPSRAVLKSSQIVV